MLQAGDVLARKYQIVRMLGAGGMSNIYLCRIVGSPGPDRFWVIKEMSVIYQDPAEQATAIELFQREGELLQRLDHKNLPKVIDRFYHGGKYHFVMEYVEGEDLGKLITRYPQGLPEQMVLPWAIEIATVLYYLHCQKPPIIFRDIKPANIMIANGVVKLIDFGIARAFKPNKKKDTISIGSPGYAPPEQYSGQTDPRSDLYALGASMHHLLTGKDPTETRTPFKFEPVSGVNPSVSQTLSDIVAKCIDIDPSKRFNSALELKKALQACAGVQTGVISAVPPSPPPPAHKGPTGTTAISGPPPLPPIAPPPASTAPVPVPNPALNATPPVSAPTPAPAPAPPTPAPPPPPPPAPGGVLAALRRTVIKVLVCAVLAVALRLGLQPIRVRYEAWRHPRPTVTPTPVAVDPLADARSLLAHGQAAGAVRWLETWVDAHPDDVVAKLMLEDAQAAATVAGSAGGLSLVQVGLVLPDGPGHDAVLRGALLGLRQFNQRGGAHGVLASVLPEDTRADLLEIAPVNATVAGGKPVLSMPLPAQAADSGTPTSPGNDAWWDKLAATLGQKPDQVKVLVVGTGSGVPTQWKATTVAVDQAAAAVGGPYDVIVPTVSGPHLGDTLKALATKFPKTPMVLPPFVLNDVAPAELPAGTQALTWWWPAEASPRGEAFVLRYSRDFPHGAPDLWVAEAANAVLALQAALSGTPTPDGVLDALKTVTVPPVGLQDLLPIGSAPPPPTWMQLQLDSGQWQVSQ
ncbi:MAG: protein kinase domain-containing protein [Candidatus Xenobia bacterium]